MKGGKEADLFAEGWIKKTTIGEPRLSEIVENYRQLGYEVQVVEQSTGEISFGAGFSTTAGVLGDISVRERNLLGKGQPQFAWIEE